MSTSVYKTPEILRIPLGFPTKSSPLKVKRSLFGPVDHELNKKFLEKHLEADYTRFCEKWNFNFREEKTLNPEGAFVWSSPGSQVTLYKKRKLLADDSEDCYYQPEIEERFVFQPIEPAVQHQDSTTLIQPKQRVITDYYTLKRKNAASGKDKQQPHEALKPNKIPKLGNCSS